MSTPNPVPAPAAGTSLSDILTAIKNLVTAINSAAQNYLNIAGTSNLTSITAPTVVKSSPGRIVEVSIIVAGSSTGTIYDGATTTATTRPIIPMPNIVGVYRVSWPTSYGILVSPGSGQTVSVSYS
jgi:hypothetical protein